MGYLQDKLTTAQRQLQDYLDRNNQGIDSTLNNARDYLSGQDALSAKNSQDILSQVGGRYGIQGLGAAGSDYQSVLDPQIQAKRDAALGQMKMQRTGDRYNKLFNQALDAYQAQGYDLRQSQSFARSLLQDQMSQKAQAGSAEQGRDYAKRKSDITEQYRTLYTAIDNQNGPNPYEAALTRALLNLGTNAVSYAIINGKKVPVDNTGQPTYTPPSTGNYSTDLTYGSNVG